MNQNEKGGSKDLPFFLDKTEDHIQRKNSGNLIEPFLWRQKLHTMGCPVMWETGNQ
jgi:hypothetical protein